MFKESLKKDVINQAGSIYSMNAPHAIGYLFTIAKGGKEVHTGMFCHSVDEVNRDSWSGFYHIKKGLFYDLDSDKSYKGLMNELTRK